MNPYRVAGRQCVPACSHCMTSRWVSFDAMWAWWTCTVCGETWDP
jgi:hypothetical protein